MSLTKLDIDRFITTLRTKSKEFNSISNVQLASMLEETISNINEVAFFGQLFVQIIKEQLKLLQRVKNG